MRIIIVVYLVFTCFLAFSREENLEREEARLINIYGPPVDILDPFYMKEKMEDEPLLEICPKIQVPIQTTKPIQLEKKKDSVSQRLIAHIEKFEGFKSKAYYDLDGGVAIGYGFRKSDIPGLTMGDTITREEAHKVLIKVIKKYRKVVDEVIEIPIKDHQRDALISFSYNVGPNAFKRSTLVKKINKKDIAGASIEFLRWCHVGDKEMPGLIKRRKAEKKMFLGESEKA